VIGVTGERRISVALSSTPELSMMTKIFARCSVLLKHYATSREVVGSNLDEAIRIFQFT
jgi:hypothetical protein